MSVKKAIKNAEKELTKAIQKVIKSEGLVDSGRLLKSIEVTVSPTLDVSIVAEDYYEYLDDEYKITEQAQNNTKVTDAFAEVLAAVIEEQIDKALK